ncbi:hypothetical protein ACP70R_020171 [Stipagrostis hirtigluma subsp. patula]
MVGTEATVLCALVSGTLKIIANKLAPLLAKEYSSIVGVTKDLEELHGLVEEISRVLEVGHQAVGNRPSSNWLRQLKDISYCVDDLVDEFHLKAEKHDADGRKHIVSKFLFQCKVAHKIKAIKKRFAAIVKQRNDFSAITNSLSVDRPVQLGHNTTVDMQSLPTLNAASVLGRDEEKHKIISKLVETNEQRKINIICITGLGGLGKTTLAKLVFNDSNTIEQHFEVKHWVHVSEDFDVKKLLEKLFESITGTKSECYPLQHMSKMISDKLIRKRYLLVLDDIWTQDKYCWEQFMEHLEMGAAGSRILLTTRNRNVANVVGSRSTDIFDLPLLSEADSWQMFEQCFEMTAELDSDFLDVGKAILKKCGGVPLAIKVFAGVLRQKKRIEEWQAIRDSNLLDVEDKESRVFACLKLSYLNLPPYLKQCFTICALFPKGFCFVHEQLIDLWIAHDMITLSNDIDCVEHSGIDCFNSLVQMSFLQVLEETDCGRVRCSMHDLVHDLALLILGDDISFVSPKETAGVTKSYRYFSLIKQARNHLPKSIFEKARAIYVSADDDFKFGNSLSNAKHLRSITIGLFHTIGPTTILQAKNLRYLCIPLLNCETLPEAISDIWSLQALHLVQSNLLELPKSIGKLKMLRTVNLSWSRRLKCLPDSIGDCHMISLIDLYYCRELTVLPNSIDRNKNLRVLRLSHTNIEKLPPGITTLGHLERLYLDGCWRLQEFPDGFGNLKKLEVLNLQYCKLRSMPVGFGQLTRLQKLRLFVVGEGEKSAQISELGNVARITGNLTISNIAGVMDPTDAYRACLKQKTNLQRLELIWGRNDRVNVENDEAKEEAILDGLEPPSRIEVLQMSGYAGGRYALWMLNQFTAEVQGAPCFPYLTVMKLSNFPNLKHLQGITELPCLQELELIDMPALETISGGPFPSLVQLVMRGMPSLEEVWMVTERATLADGEEGDCVSSRSSYDLGQVRIGIRLSHLRIYDCPKLKVKPHLPLSLQHLWIAESSEQLLLWPDHGQGPSSPSSYPPSISFSHLKELELCRMRVSSRPAPGLGSRHGWELLQHMTALESLKICRCDGLSELPESIRSLTSLQSLCIDNNSALCLHQYAHTARIGGCPPWIHQTTSVDTMFQLPEWLGELCSLRNLQLQCLPGLNSLPQSLQRLTSFQELTISGCRALHELPDWLGKLLCLRTLRLVGLPSLSSLPQSLEHLTSLQELEIIMCHAIHQLPECLGKLRSLQTMHVGGLCIETFPQSLQHLTSLQELEIRECYALHQLPECLGELRSLRTFRIERLPGLAFLPQSMCRLTSLEQFRIVKCLGLTSLPDWIKGLTALQTLEISRCPGLMARCEKGKGEDWHLVSHIPYLNVW